MINRFKEIEPKDTIKKVLSIMIDDLDVYPMIKYNGNSFLNVFSNQVGIGTMNPVSVNGKGTTAEFSLASGCGEFMERIQSYVLIPRDFDKKFFLDEIVNEEGVQTPYYCYNTNKFEYFSVKKVFKDTTGLAAGNTYEEAAVQAICEILERDIVCKFLDKRLKIHNIIQNEELFEFLNIEKFEKYFNTKITFFDVSQTKIPVVMMIAARGNNTYMIQFGSAPSIEIACERCVTEFMQGNDGSDSSRFMPVGDFESNSRLDFFFYTNNGKMLLAQSVLDNIINQQISNEYNYKDFSSNKEVLNYVLNNKEIFGDIYVRDYGFLGFPVVHFICSNMENFCKEVNYNSSMIFSYLFKIYGDYAYSKEVENYYLKMVESITRFLNLNKAKKQSPLIMELQEKLFEKSIKFDGSKCEQLFKERI